MGDTSSGRRTEPSRPCSWVGPGVSMAGEGGSMRENIKFIAGICRLAGGVNSSLNDKDVNFSPSRADESGRDRASSVCTTNIVLSKSVYNSSYISSNYLLEFEVENALPPPPPHTHFKGLTSYIRGYMFVGEGSKVLISPQIKQVINQSRALVALPNST